MRKQVQCQRAAPQIHLLFPPAGKEYARADSRFASRDALMLAQETITAVFEGPLCFIVLWGMLNDAVSQDISRLQMLSLTLWLWSHAQHGWNTSLAGLCGDSNADLNGSTLPH